MAEHNREQFIDQVIRHVGEKFPLVKLARGVGSFSLKINGHAASLENLYRITMLRPDESLHHIDRWVVELLRAGEGTPDQKGDFEALRDRIFPMVLPATSTAASAGAVIEPLVEGLSLAYAIDHDRTIAYIPKKQMDAWDVSVDDLHEQAMKNLGKVSESLEGHAAQDEEGKINLILFQKLDGYDASRLLLPTLHEKLRSYLGSPFCAGIPNRDILLCFRNDEETVARLRRQVADDYRSMPHQVTDKLLLVTPDGIAMRD